MTNSNDWDLTQRIINDYNPQPDNRYLRAVENAGITDEQIAELETAEQLQELLENADQNNQYIRAKPLIVSDEYIAAAYRPTPLLPGVASQRASLLAAEPGVGKSAIALSMCAAVATGQNIAGFEPNNPIPSRCLFISLEEETAEILLRAAAIKQRYQCDYKDNLIVAGANNVEFLTTDDTIRTFMQHGEQELRNLIYEYDAEFVVLDPLSIFPIGEENNTNHAAFFQILNRICSELHTTILVIHHVRKPPAGFIVKTSLNDVRGSSTIVGSVRSAMIVNKSADYITMTYAKVQYGAPPPDAHFIHSQEVIATDLGDYATLVLTQHERQQLDINELQAYIDKLRLLFDATPSYRCSPQANDWLGTALADNLNIDIGQDHTNNKQRSAEQKRNRTRMTESLIHLESLSIISKDKQTIANANRHSKAVDVWIAGAELNDE